MSGPLVTLARPGAWAALGRAAFAFGAATAATLAIAAPAPRVLLLDAALAGPTLLAVGEHGAILRSTDAGANWSPSPSGTRATLTGVAFAPDGRHGWAVGHDALIVATNDGGVSWQRQWQGPSLEASLLDVCALSDRQVIAVGAYGLYLATVDGGRSWQERKILDEDMHLNRITRGPTGTLYIAGERGTLLRSRDAGATWARIDSPYDGSFYGILPLSARDLLAFGLRGRVFRSADDGETWTAAPVDRPMLLATAVKTKAGAIVLAGQSRACYGSRDGAAPFVPLAGAGTDAIAELLEAPDGRLWSFGEGGAQPLVPAWPAEAKP
jgi:photosystem II stability/assembly factor-like uncharacterized protein